MAAPTDSYLSYLLSRPLNEVWALFLLGLARIVPTVALAPFLGGKTLPDTLKVGLGIAIVVIFLPFLVVQVTTPLPLDLRFLALMAKEAILGAFLGFLITIPFYYVQAAGALIDHQRGGQSLQVTDPSTQTQTSPMGTFYNNMMLISFFLIGGPILFFDALFTSFKVLPPDQFFPSSFFDSSTPFWVTIFGLFNTFATICLQMAAPPLICMLLSDLFLGIANRMAPQVQISFLMWSFKAFIGIALVWAGWWLVLHQMDLHAIQWIKLFQKLVTNLLS